jgi:phage gp46-like protein
MPDILTRYQVVDTDGAYILTGDWVFEAPDLVNDDGLETAVVLSLFTDDLAGDEDVLPSLHGDDRRGWWAGPMGSLLWLLSREKETEDVRQRAEFYTRKALQWMLDDDVADRIDAAASWAETGRLDIEVAIYRLERLIFSKPYSLEWAAVQRGVH